MELKGIKVEVLRLSDSKPNASGFALENLGIRRCRLTVRTGDRGVTTVPVSLKTPSQPLSSHNWA